MVGRGMVGIGTLGTGQPRCIPSSFADFVLWSDLRSTWTTDNQTKQLKDSSNWCWLGIVITRQPRWFVCCQINLSCKDSLLLLLVVLITVAVLVNGCRILAYVCVSKAAIAVSRLSPSSSSGCEGADCRILAHWDDRGSGGNTKSVRWEGR